MYEKYEKGVDKRERNWYNNTRRLKNRAPAPRGAGKAKGFEGGERNLKTIQRRKKEQSDSERDNHSEGESSELWRARGEEPEG